MDISSIISKVDHTVLNADATLSDVLKACDDAARYGAASVCVPPCFVAKARSHAGGSLKIGTVAGFPYGFSTTAAKVYEAADAVENGADEIDMVISIWALKQGCFEVAAADIRAVREACPKTTLKVIVEACLLTQAEKIEACKAVTQSGADYIKTSTGFSTGGATAEDVLLFKEHIGPNVKIKAAGGISTLEQAGKLIELGAARIGSSRLLKLVKSYWPSAAESSLF